MYLFCFYQLVLYLCLIICQSEQAKAEKCEINGVVGECVPLPECPELVSLLKNSSTTAEGLDASHDLRCGLGGQNIKVCCEVDVEKSPMTVRRLLEDDGDKSDFFVDAFPAHDTCGWTDENRSIWMIKILTEQEIKSGSMYVINNGVPVVSRDMSRFMALLGYKDESAVLWNCGGSVITEKHILTAAHCIKDNLYVVRVGELDLALEEKDASPIDFLIKKKIPHEKYKTHFNDIGILVLDGKINFREEHHVGPICLPLDSRKKELTDYNLYGGQHSGIFIAGWGEAPEMRTRPTWLAYTHVNVIEDSECKRLYDSPNSVIDERVFCAGDMHLKHDSCNGDSGGPIVAEYRIPELNTTFFYQLGIISYGYRCTSNYFTGVYTNVTTFLPWIREKVLTTMH